MTLRKFLSVALLALMATTVSAQQIDRSMIPQIPVDKNVRIGKLDNGLTYYIRYNNWPENKANFYIAQRVGPALYLTIATFISIFNFQSSIN